MAFRGLFLSKSLHMGDRQLIKKPPEEPTNRQRLHALVRRRAGAGEFLGVLLFPTGQSLGVLFFATARFTSAQCGGGFNFTSGLLLRRK